MKIKVIIISALVIIGMSFSVYEYEKTIPVLEPPQRVIEAVSITDGGSFYVAIEGRNGNQIIIGTRGSLDTPAKDQPLYYSTENSILKLPYYLKAGSKQEKTLLTRLRGWAANIEGSGKDALNALILLMERREINAS